MASTHENPVRKFHGNAAILTLLQQQTGSDQSIKSFCLANGIATGTFHNWKTRYSRSSNQSGFATVQIVPDTGLSASVVYAMSAPGKTGAVNALQLVSTWVIPLLLIPSVINSFLDKGDAGRIRIADADREYSNHLQG